MRRDKDFFKLLIIEDNLGDFILVSDFLEEMVLAPDIDHVTSFKEAAKKLRELTSQPYSAILLDLTLPDKSGEELIVHTLQHAQQIPVIVLTGYTDASFAIKSLHLGASDYLLKDELTATTLYKSLIYNIERNKNLLRLKESEMRYSELFHLSPQPMWVVASEGYAFLDVNEAAINHYGYSREEFLNMSLADIMPLTELSEFSQEGKDNDNATFLGSYIHRKKSGAEISVELRRNSLQFKGLKAEVILANDVTERITHMGIIENQNKRLKEIAFEQSHIVRAPLSRLMGLINMIKTTNVTDRDELYEFLGYIETSAYEIDAIIREIVGKTESLKKENFIPPTSESKDRISGNRYHLLIAKIDEVNQSDPNRDSAGNPRELVYSERMSETLSTFCTEASEYLQIAARAQHIKRWSIPRDSYPMDRKGYLMWRTELKKMHGALTGELMHSCGYTSEEIQHVDDLINKRQLKTNPDAQCLEDVVCLVFLRYYFDEFIAKHQEEEEKIVDILQKTWKKMSTKAHEAALKLPLSSQAVQLISKALDV